jgi:hypothetical protein
MGLSTGPDGTGVFGGNINSVGQGIGVRGETKDGVGVRGVGFGEGVGLEGHSHSNNRGLAGRFIGNVHIQGNPGTSSGDLRVDGTSSFGGDVTMSGNLNMSSPAGDITLGDVAEGFTSEDESNIEPGTVVVLNQQGQVRPGVEAYDKKVAGVVSGAGNFRPAIVLDKQRLQPGYLPIALIGKVCCKVDARYSPIEVGDLLTTSPTTGHAMKAVDPLKSFGSVIGKALRPLLDGQGVIPILIAMQ